MSDQARRIAYVTGTRADFGLMQTTLRQIARHPGLDLSMVVTGTHLLPEYGETWREIAAAGLPVSERIALPAHVPTGAHMARNIGVMLTAFVDAFERLAPDVVLLLGDRGEMLAAALAAIHLNIAVAHIHGGERSGTVDEPVRHAISKLSHLHFVSSEDARERLIRMGERESDVTVTGAPGLDGLTALAVATRAELCAEAGFDAARPVALFVFHPVLQEAGEAGEQAQRLTTALADAGVQCLALMPNSDAGSAAVRCVLTDYAQRPGVRLLTHLPRERFVSWMAACDVMVGNSSSGIIEAGSFGTPVINVGVRQNLRQRNANVADVPIEPLPLLVALKKALENGRFPAANCYGDGRAAERIVERLVSAPIDSALLLKCNTY